MFTQSCFIRKNSKGLNEKLKQLGYYTYDIESYEDVPDTWNTVAEPEADYAGIWNSEPKGDFAKRCIDCGTNEDLFLAIAALRDDTDRNQWFVYDNSEWANDNEKERVFLLCKEDKIETFACIDLMYKDCHKATVQELIEHFNTEE